jgi:hypothetical protein
VNHVYYPLAESNGKLLTLLKALKAKGGVQRSRRRVGKHMSASSLSALEAKKEFEFIIPLANPPDRVFSCARGRPKPGRREPVVHVGSGVKMPDLSL